MYNKTCLPGSAQHVVKSGDTLGDLAKTYGVSVQSIIDANPGINATNLRIGSTLCVPTVRIPLSHPQICSDSASPYIVQSGDTLWNLSQIYGVSVQSILALNPDVDPQNLQIGSTLCIPSAPTTPTPTTPILPVTCAEGAFSYTVQTGDTLWKLSQIYGVSVQSILALNPGVDPLNLQIGSTLCIPSAPTTLTPTAPVPPTTPTPTTPPLPVTCAEGGFSYTVQMGDTLWNLSQIYGVSVESILALNPGVDPLNLQIGSTLCIPSAPTTLTPTVPVLPTTPTPTTPILPVTCAEGAFSYTVQMGDTLWNLSQIYGVSVQSILALNPGVDPQNLQIGSTLCIPYAPVPSENIFIYLYMIQKCDTICSVARKFHISVESILLYNPGINPKCLQVGLCIYIPINCCTGNTCRYAARAGDTLSRIANKFNISPSALVAANPNINFQHLIRCQVICIPIA